MKFSIYSLHPDIFTSFFETSLIARGIEKSIISYELINWRQTYGIGTYKQVDDKPYGGGTGMVLMCEPIFKALLHNKALGYQFESFAYEILEEMQESIDTSYNLDFLYAILNKMEERKKLENLSFITSHTQRMYPPNIDFIDFKQKNPGKKNITISMTPKGYPFSQPIAQYLASEFDHISLLCGRYEGFDARISECVDLEISMGPYITNGGEVPAMALIESVSRLLPEFVTKRDSVLHDSFSLTNNYYTEQKEFIFGKKRLESKKFVDSDDILTTINPHDLFDDIVYRDDILPKLEHPVYTKPSSWRGLEIPPVLLSGDHKKIHQWRNNWHNTHGN